MYEANDIRTLDDAKTNQFSDLFLRDVVASGPAAVLVINRDNLRIVFNNRQFERTFGYTSEDLSADGFDLFSLLEKDEAERLQYQLNVVLHDKESRSRYTIYKIRYKSGEYKFTYLYASPLEEAENSGLYYIMLIPDVSKWDLPFLSFDTRDLFLEQFNKEGFGTFEWLMETNKVFWTKGLYSVFEVEEDREIDFDFTRKFVYPDDRKDFGESLRRMLNEGGRLEETFRVITEKQNVKTLHTIARVILDESGKPIKLLGSVRDITQQKQIEDNMKRNLEDLNRSNKELEEFAYVASHDLQEPLRKISTFSDRLSEKYGKELTGEGAMYLQRMMVSAENMRQLINSLLEFSRVAKSTQPFGPVNLNFVLHEVKNELELVIEETGTSIVSSFLPIITASITEMKQLFANIISNAIKFRKLEEKPVINIDSRVLTPQEKISYNLNTALNYYRIQIQDNGIGFENEYATRIFQVFQRLHGKSEYPGSGIGLAICKKIVEHHHGYIYAENIPDKGACFVIMLPEKLQGQKQSQ